MTSTARLSNDIGELIDLSLGATEGTEPLLGELTGTLVLAVAEEFDNSALVWGKTDEQLEFNCTQWVDWISYPATSLTMSLTKAVRLLSFPLEREMRGLFWRASTTYRYNMSVHLYESRCSKS